MIKKVYPNRRWRLADNAYTCEILYKGNWHTIATLCMAPSGNWYKQIQRDFMHIGRCFYLFSRTIKVEECIWKTLEECQAEVEVDVENAIWNFFRSKSEILELWRQEEEIVI